MCMLIIVSCTPCCMIASINFHMIMHPDFTLRLHQKNPNLNLSSRCMPLEPLNRVQGMQAEDFYDIY